MGSIVIQYQKWAAKQHNYLQMLIWIKLETKSLLKGANVLLCVRITRDHLEIRISQRSERFARKGGLRTGLQSHRW